ncbi:MAG: TetR/AcrR family transcriptional regulator [Acidobacteriaceae bacterium]|nr:TetR/AcrR family transcriptional regulator [Acidobacteriaceae bacterium]
MTEIIQQGEPRKFKAGEELRNRLLDAASRLFGEAGYEDVSIRSIAQAAGCSQMAMYRHFPDKEALIRHLCTELYRKFTTALHDRFDYLPDPGARLRQALRHFVLLSLKNPHHYRLTFLAPTIDTQSMEMRNSAASPAISYFRQNLKLALPAGSSDELVEERLHQILACLHGMTIMLITHPRSYRLSKEAALRQLETAFNIFLTTPAAPIHSD